MVPILTDADKPAPGAAPASGSATGPDRGPAAEQLYLFLEKRVTRFDAIYYDGKSPLESQIRERCREIQEAINLTFQGRPHLPTPRQALQILLFRYLKKQLYRYDDPADDPLAAEVCAEIGGDPKDQLY